MCLFRKLSICPSHTVLSHLRLPCAGVKVDIPVLTSQDVMDLQQFACKNKMDFVAASFVQVWRGDGQQNRHHWCLWGTSWSLEACQLLPCYLVSCAY